jgi:methylthioribose-1-phosphate isomerase
MAPAGQLLSPIASGGAAGQALLNQDAAGSNKRDGLVADSYSSLATAAATGVAIGASKALASQFASQVSAFNQALDSIDTSSSDALGLLDEAEQSLNEINTLGDKANNASKYGTPIIDAALITHLLLSLANGFGTPNSGTQLGSAAGELDWAVDRLTTAGKTDGWTSPVAEPRYREANTVQQERVAKIADIDRKFEKALKDQATQVYDLKETFGYIKTAMNSAKILAMALNMAGPPGQAASVVLQTTTATACLLADASHQGMQHQNAQQNEIEFDKLASAYQACQQP